MIEKTSKDVRCTLCDKPAVIIVAGLPYCASCAKSEEAEEAVELVESFEAK
jgi:hypothetical protein